MKSVDGGGRTLPGMVALAVTLFGLCVVAGVGACLVARAAVCD